MLHAVSPPEGRATPFGGTAHDLEDAGRHHERSKGAEAGRPGMAISLHQCHTFRPTRNLINIATLKGLIAVIREVQRATSPELKPKNQFESTPKSVRKSGSWWHSIDKVQRTPSWATPTFLPRDLIHQLTSIGAYPHALALYADPALTRSIISKIERDSKIGVRLATASEMESSFLSEERSATIVHAAGIHSRRRTAPSSKSLAGPHLQEALNPSDDSTFTLSSARLGPPAGDRDESGLGATPGRGRVWTRPAADYDDFRRQVDAIIRKLDDCSGKKSILADFFAEPLGSLDGVKDPYALT